MYLGLTLRVTDHGQPCARYYYSKSLVTSGISVLVTLSVKLQCRDPCC